MCGSLHVKSAPVVTALAGIPEVRGILCFGSYAMGTFDADSDFDFYVFCSPDIMSADTRRHVFGRIAAVHDVNIDESHGGRENDWFAQNDQLRVGAIAFDICYNTVAWIQALVSAVKTCGVPSTPQFGFRPYTVLGLLDRSIILHDPDATIQTLKASLYPYPKKLKQALLAEHLGVIRSSLQDLQDYVERSIGNLAFHFHLVRLSDSLCGILFALNERYDPASKRTELVLRDLRIVPDRFLERFTETLETPLTVTGRQEIVRSLTKLVDEIDDLAKDQMS